MVPIKAVIFIWTSQFSSLHSAQCPVGLPFPRDKDRISLFVGDYLGIVQSDVSGEQNTTIGMVGPVVDERKRKIVRLGGNKLLKYGPSSQIDLEVANMQYIAENTTIPVPRIYRVEVQAGGIKSILMNYIDDRTLEEAWPSMIPSQKVSIAQELHGFILQLRDLTNGSDPEAGGQRFRDLQTKNLMTSLSTECDYQSTVPSFFRMGSLFPDNSHWSSSVSRKDNLFFTHGDLAPRNILVSQEGHVTAVLDWEYAGWYPEWWEAVKAYEFCNDLPGWAAYLSIILPPSHATEYMTMALATRFVR